MRLYVNGTLDNLNNASPVARNTAGGLNIGAQFSGKIGEVAVYNSALTADEIKGHYEMGSL